MTANVVVIITTANNGISMMSVSRDVLFFVGGMTLTLGPNLKNSLLLVNIRFATQSFSVFLFPLHGPIA